MLGKLPTLGCLGVWSAEWDDIPCPPGCGKKTLKKRTFSVTRPAEGDGPPCVFEDGHEEAVTCVNMSCDDGTECLDVQLKNGNPWHDSYGPTYTCQWYDESTCADKFKSEGYSSASACCICGGGLRRSADGTTRPPEPSADTSKSDPKKSSSCVNSCGKFYITKPCNCDELCGDTGDCCRDYVSVCVDGARGHTPTSVTDAELAVDCKGRWSADWSAVPCSTTCGIGQRTRQYIIIHPEVGTGQPCPNKQGAVETRTDLCNGMHCPDPSCDDIVVNGRPWHDATGMEQNCAWYGATLTRCTLEGGNFAWSGLSANDACCVCGGGVRDDTTTTTTTMRGMSCVNRCFSYTENSPCQCDSRCHHTKDCCEDFDAACQSDQAMLLPVDNYNNLKYTIHSCRDLRNSGGTLDRSSPFIEIDLNGKPIGRTNIARGCNPIFEYANVIDGVSTEILQLSFTVWNSLPEGLIGRAYVLVDDVLTERIWRGTVEIVKDGIPVGALDLSLEKEVTG